MMIDDFTARPCSAYMRLKIVLPVHGKAAEGPVLVRDKAFAEFEDKLQKRMNVVATFEGSFVPVFVWRDQRRTKINEESDYGLRDKQSDGFLILHRVRDVVGRPKPHR
ncbi:MAG TPA: hypothetical protein VF911_14625 [Thermoanaerobaculia bacterium]